jgi:hypothetical protein
MKLNIITSKYLYLMQPILQVRILFKKIPKNKIYSNITIDEIIQMSNELTKTAQTASGFISSKSFWDKDLSNSFDIKKNLYTFSDWQNIKYWNSWLESDQRKETLDKYNIKFNSEITVLTNKIDPFLSIPLL